VFYVGNLRANGSKSAYENAFENDFAALKQEEIAFEENETDFFLKFNRRNFSVVCFHQNTI
jgi:UDPglucose--hexose-1-phosphate uridylyltransferase